MKYIITILLSITTSLIFGTYVGNKTLELNNDRMASAYLMGCGLGIQKGKNYVTPLNMQEVVFCMTAAAMFREILELTPSKPSN